MFQNQIIHAILPSYMKIDKFISCIAIIMAHDLVDNMEIEEFKIFQVIETLFI